MSIYSDYKCGALSDEEFASECARMNREERYYDAEDECADEEENGDIEAIKADTERAKNGRQ